MLTVETEDLLDRIRVAPRGARIAAFFDFDGTIIQGYSAALLYEQRYRRLEVGLGETLRLLQFTQGDPTEEQFEELTTEAIRGWAGRPESYLDDLATQLYRGGIAKALFHEAWRLIKAHQRRGHTVVIASSATTVQIAALAKDLGVTDVLCTQVETVDGRVTGRLAGRTLWGPGKEAAVREFAEQRGIDLARSHAYGNGDEDVAYLSTVGHPVAVNPQPQLREHAQRHTWPVVEFERSPGRFDLVSQLRWGGMWAALASAGTTGVAMSLLSRDRWRGINLTISAFTHLAAALADVKVHVVDGEEHLWSHRPAVFLINHQSDFMDLLVGAILLRENVTALAKKEVSTMPILGPIVNYAQFALVDRGDPAQAREALSHAVARIQQGISVVVAPEGTRSNSPSVRRFKKGAFHLAQQAGVPIIPIVIRNSGQLMSPASRSVRPGTVDVLVHPPIHTDGWTKDDVDRTAEQIHQFYVDTLEAWPGPGPAAYVGQRKKTSRSRARSGATSAATSAPHPGPAPRAPRAARTAPRPDPGGQ
jgi:putative phosphoserine phosphatase/1-acylglycerol-3-phosphate O-acyltransferase